MIGPSAKKKMSQYYFFGLFLWCLKLPWSCIFYKHFVTSSHEHILGDPGAASWGDGIFTGESLQRERESPWAFTLTQQVAGAFEIPLADWPEKFSALVVNFRPWKSRRPN